MNDDDEAIGRELDKLERDLAETKPYEQYVGCAAALVYLVLAWLAIGWLVARFLL